MDVKDITCRGIFLKIYSKYKNTENLKIVVVPAQNHKDMIESDNNIWK